VTSRGRLALFGGEPTVPEGLEQPWPHITAEDKAAVMAVLDRGLLWGHDAPETTRLQDEWAAFLGLRHCLATNSGTAALHMAIAAVGAGPGDEVITTALSWTSTGTSILSHNAIPVFVDVEGLTANIDATRIEEKITERTKAIVPVHLNGLPADLDPILELARRRGIAVIEDGSQAHGAEYRGRKVGTFGDCAIFSVHASKNLSGGEGGLFVTDDDAIHEAAARTYQFGEARREAGRDFDAKDVGWNYRTSEMAAAYTRSQLARLPETIERVRENLHALRHLLGGLAGISPPHEPADRQHVFWRFPVRLTPEEIGVDLPVGAYAEKIRAALRAEGVNIDRSNLVIPAMTLFREQSGYARTGCPWTCNRYTGEVQYRAEDYPVALETFERTVSVVGRTPPNGRPLMERYAEAFYKVHENLDELLERDHSVTAS
jgi:perosamine synthetase